MPGTPVDTAFAFAARNVPLLGIVLVPAIVLMAAFAVSQWFGRSVSLIRAKRWIELAVFLTIAAGAAMCLVYPFGVALLNEALGVPGEVALPLGAVVAVLAWAGVGTLVARRYRRRMP